jgi:ribonucleoside-diphosphate reductase alpha chain
MRSGEHDVARAYVLYREERAQARARRKKARQEGRSPACTWWRTAQRKPLDRAALRRLLAAACAGPGPRSPDAILEATLRDLYDGVPMEEVRKSAILAARALIEKDPPTATSPRACCCTPCGWKCSARSVAGADGDALRRATSRSSSSAASRRAARPELGKFDLAKLGKALKPSATCSSATSACRRCTTATSCTSRQRIELPQAFFMRVAMGLALNEKDREARAIEFYNVLSTFDFMSSTPTLFNSGTLRSQLLSCYLTTVADDLDGIYDAIKENALLAKYAGGLGNDWTPVRALGSTSRAPTASRRAWCRSSRW